MYELDGIPWAMTQHCDTNAISWAFILFELPIPHTLKSESSHDFNENSYSIEHRCFDLPWGRLMFNSVSCDRISKASQSRGISGCNHQTTVGLHRIVASLPRMVSLPRVGRRSLMTSSMPFFRVFSVWTWVRVDSEARKIIKKQKNIDVHDILAGRCWSYFGWDHVLS